MKAAAACAVLVALSSSSAAANSTTTRLAKFVHQACKALSDEDANDETRVARVGVLVRTTQITEHVYKPFTRFYFKSPLLVGWELFLQSGQITISIPDEVSLQLRDLEREMGKATEQEEDIHGRLQGLDPNKPLLRSEAAVAIPPPQRVYEYRNRGPRGLCTATLYLEGQSEIQSPRRYRITRLEIVD